MSLMSTHEAFVIIPNDCLRLRSNYSALHRDKEEEEALRLAKILEEEKAQFSVSF